MDAVKFNHSGDIFLTDVHLKIHFKFAFYSGYFWQVLNIRIFEGKNRFKSEKTLFFSKNFLLNSKFLDNNHQGQALIITSKLLSIITKSSLININKIRFQCAPFSKVSPKHVKKHESSQFHAIRCKLCALNLCLKRNLKKNNNTQTTQKMYEKQQKIRAYIILECAVLPKMPTQNIFSRWI